MMAWRRLRTLRAKLTIWYVFAMVVVLTVYAVGVFTVVSRNASLALDELVVGDFQWASEMVEQRPDGTFAWFEGTGVDDSPWLQVWTPSGELLYRSVGALLHPVPNTAALAATPGEQIVTVSLPSANFRLLSGSAQIGGRRVVIQVARSDGKLRQELRELMIMLVLGLPLGVAAAGLVGYSIARRALKPLDLMAERARAITADRLSDRLPIENPDEELGRLAKVFNETLGRLESSFQQMRRFTSDVSHELRTPLTAIRSVGEVGLRERHEEGRYRSIIGSMLEEADRLATLVDSLLSMARAETGQARLSLQAVDLRQLSEDVAAHLGVLAEEKQQTLSVEGLATLPCTGDPLVLRQALINLVDNAIKYTQEGGSIRVQLSQAGGTGVVDVCDNGPGVAMQRPEQVFDRFARGDAADPADGSGGTGLGLSISKWGIEANGGQLSLVKTGASGSIFRMTVPLASQLRQKVAS